MAASMHAEEVGRILSAKSHYDVLGSGLSRSSTDEEVRRTYLMLARRTHPDKNAHEHAAEAFKRVQNAFEALETEPKRDQYHYSSRSEGLGHPDDDNNDGPGEDPFAHSDFFRTAFRAGFGFGMNGHGFGPRGGLSPEDFLMEMFLREMLFGAGGGGGGPHRSGQFGEDGEVYEDEDDEDGGEAHFVDVGGGMFLCEGCGVYLYGEDALYEHRCDGDEDYFDENVGEVFDDEDEDDQYEEEEDESGLEHIEVSTRTGQFRCGLCDMNIRGGEDKVFEHVQGRKHRSAMDRLAEDYTPRPSSSASAARAPAQQQQQPRSGVKYPGSARGGAARRSPAKSSSGSKASTKQNQQQASSASKGSKLGKSDARKGAPKTATSDQFHEDLASEEPFVRPTASQQSSEQTKKKKPSSKGQRDLEPSADELFHEDFANWHGPSEPSAPNAGQIRGNPPVSSSTLTCDLCQVTVSSQAEFNQHLMGKRHAKESMKGRQ